MSEPEITDESFVVAVKLAIMRNCMSQTDEKKAFRLITENSLKIFTKIMANDNKNIQILEDSVKDLFNNVNMLITSKADRIVEFIENLRKLDQDVIENIKEVGNIQQRWTESYKKLQEFTLISFSKRDHENTKTMMGEFQQSLSVDFKVYDELSEFENKMQARSKDIINVIIKSNPKTDIKGLAEVLLNDNS